MTYLEIVNSVLARLRESSVATVTATPYSTLIGKFVNDAKRNVEDSWNWDSLSQTISVNTTSGVSTYTVTGSGLRPKDATVNNTTNRNPMYNVPIQWIIDQQQLTTVQTGVPCYYAWNGNDGTDSKVELYPTPEGGQTIKFNLCVPQAPLSADSDVLLTPYEPVELGAYARAIAERGEDGGLASSEAFSLYKGSLGDWIAHEAGRFTENDSWSVC